MTFWTIQVSLFYKCWYYGIWRIFKLFFYFWHVDCV